MQPRLALGILLALAAPSLASAQTPCGAWQRLGPMAATGYAGTPTDFAVDEVAGRLYAVEQCYCGWHGINMPTFYWLSGTSWNPFGTEFEQGTVRGMGFLDDGTGRALHAWGSQQTWPYLPSFIRYLPSTGWGALPASVSIAPNDVVVFDDGSGPAFHAANGGVAKWNGSAWASLGSFTGTVYGAWRVQVYDDGSGAALYTAGTFTSISGLAVAGIARWDGATWSALGSGLGALEFVTRLVTIRDQAGNGLYVAGRFATAGGAAANGLARWSGTAWTPLGVGLPSNAFVEGIAWFDSGDGTGPHVIASGHSGSTGFMMRLAGGTWSSMPAPPDGGQFNGGPLVVFDRPETPGMDLIGVGRWSSSWYSPAPISMAACDLTGELSCFGDGSGGPCPCGNDSVPGELSGCQHSFGYGATLRARGRASLASDSLRLEGASMTNSSALYFQGGTFHAPIPFGDGLKCTGGPFIRFSNKMNAGGASVYPEPGDASVSVRGQISAPGTRHYQVRYRNSASFCTPDTFNYTNAVTIVWGL